MRLQLTILPLDHRNKVGCLTGLEPASKLMALFHRQACLPFHHKQHIKRFHNGIRTHMRSLQIPRPVLRGCVYQFHHMKLPRANSWGTIIVSNSRYRCLNTPMLNIYPLVCRDYEIRTHIFNIPLRLYTLSACLGKSRFPLFIFIYIVLEGMKKTMVFKLASVAGIEPASHERQSCIVAIGPYAV